MLPLHQRRLIKWAGRDLNPQRPEGHQIYSLGRCQITLYLPIVACTGLEPVISAVKGRQLRQFVQQAIWLSYATAGLSFFLITNMSSTATPKRCARMTRLSTVGKESPLSHLYIAVGFSNPKKRIRSFVVIPDLSRKSLILFPVAIISIVGISIPFCCRLFPDPDLNRELTD